MGHGTCAGGLACLGGPPGRVTGTFRVQINPAYQAFLAGQQPMMPINPLMPPYDRPLRALFLSNAPGDCVLANDATDAPLFARPMRFALTPPGRAQVARTAGVPDGADGPTEPAAHADAAAAGHDCSGEARITLTLCSPRAAGARCAGRSALRGGWRRRWYLRARSRAETDARQVAQG